VGQLNLCWRCKFDVRSAGKEEIFEQEVMALFLKGSELISEPSAVPGL
jgi:hypothetical protein